MFTTTAQERPVRFDVAFDCIRDEFRDLAFVCTVRLGISDGTRSHQRPANW